MLECHEAPLVDKWNDDVSNTIHNAFWYLDDNSLSAFIPFSVNVKVLVYRVNNGTVGSSL